MRIVVAIVSIQSQYMIALEQIGGEAGASRRPYLYVAQGLVCVLVGHRREVISLTLNSEQQELNNGISLFYTYCMSFPVQFLRSSLPTPRRWPSLVPALARIDGVVSGLRGSRRWPRVVIIRVRGAL